MGRPGRVQAAQSNIELLLGQKVRGLPGSKTLYTFEIHWTEVIRRVGESYLTVSDGAVSGGPRPALLPPQAPQLLAGVPHRDIPARVCTDPRGKVAI